MGKGLFKTINRSFFLREILKQPKILSKTRCRAGIQLETRNLEIGSACDEAQVSGPAGGPEGANTSASALTQACDQDISVETGSPDECSEWFHNPGNESPPH